MEIKNTSVIVTGGASGMGAATAKLLSELGAAVTILDINYNEAKKYATSINAQAVACDVADAEQVSLAIDQVINTQGSPRICINCAGIVHARRMVNKNGLMPLEEFNRIIQINLVGSFNLLSQCAAAMIPLDPTGEDQERGIIINTASIAAYEGQIGQTAYSASKGGIVGMTLPAARELAQFGIRVMAIAPGLVETPMFDKIPSNARESLANNVPFPKRLAKTIEFAKLVEHIIQNTMLNGSVIRMDGALRLEP